jgi:hypothetical protein
LETDIRREKGKDQEADPEDTKKNRSPGSGNKDNCGEARNSEKQRGQTKTHGEPNEAEA